MLYFHCWSGGKDSTAGIILDNIHGLPPSRVVFSEIMFDKKRGISGELPEHIDFIMNKAKPVFERWGYAVEIVRADRDYLDLFYHVIEKSKIGERRGKYAGWLLGGMCYANQALKLSPIKKYIKNFGDEEFTQYIGIAADEPKRLERIKGTNKISLLQRYGYTEKMAFDICRKYNLLSPIYEFSRRGGCWFCPNRSYREFAHTKTKHSELWEELKRINREKNVVSRGFKYGKTLEEVERLIDEEIRNQQYAAQQQTLFDFL